MMPIAISHFSDVLCIWAYVAQIRINELCAEFGDQVELDYHFCHVFGDTRTKIATRWAERGGASAYSAHVREVAARFEHVIVHPDIWAPVQPSSSMSPHLFLRAVFVTLPDDARRRARFAEAIWRFRSAFFVDAIDVSCRSRQLELAEELQLDRGAIERTIESGEAFAALSADIDLAAAHNVAVSPTLVFNEGRQRLNGNVGFRIIEA
ncbi:MAG: disulfide bond formation protein DsbA, partial [Myxococcales bacterium FL481]